jgi:hypothetical protein
MARTNARSEDPPMLVFDPETAISRNRSARLPPRVRRWLESGVAAGLGILLAYPLGSRFFWAIEKSFGQLAELHRWAVLIADETIAGLLLVACLRWTRPRLRHLDRFMTYPAAWMISGYGFAVFVMAFGLLVHPKFHELAIFAAPILAYYAAIALTLSREDGRQPIRAESSAGKQKDLSTISPAELAAWLSGEDPVRRQTEDLLGMSQRVPPLLGALLARRTRAAVEQAAPTVAITGGFGSGKTSLSYLLEDAAMGRSEYRFIFARTNCWGFESAVKAQEHILSACINRLESEIDTLALRPLPKEYANAISEAAPGLKSLVSLASDPAPSELLSRLSRVLTTIETRLVIVIEDLDRSGASFDHAQIFSLLFRLREVEQISFVLTVGAGTSVELEKVTEHVEYIRPLARELVLRIVQTVYAALRGEGYIDPQALIGRERPRGHRFDNLATASDLHWPTPIVVLVATPRLLKAVLNEFRNMWRELKGEVDIDELLMLVALRRSAPEAYQFLLHYRSDILFLGRVINDASDGPETTRNKIKTRWENLGRAADPKMQAAAAILIELYPALGALLPHGKTFPSGWRIQSVRSERGDIYLDRIHEGTTDQRQPTDQVALQLLQAAAQSAAGLDALAGALRSQAELPEVVRFFQNSLDVLSEQQKLGVVARILAVNRDIYGAKASLDETELCGTESWMGMQGGNIDVQCDWYVAQIRAALPASMTLAAQLLYRSLLHLSLAHNFRNELVAAMRDRIGELSVQEFVGSLDSENPGALLTVFTEWRPTDAVAWAPAVDVLLKALETCPEKVAVEAVRAMQGTDREQPDGAGGSFHDQRVKSIFGAKARKFYGLIANCSVPPGINVNWWEHQRNAAKHLADAIDAEN